MDRILMLQKLLQEHPQEALPRYSLAMEYAKRGETTAALAEFDALLEQHPDYSNGFFMAAQALARVGRSTDARDYLERGIASAQRTGNRHAESEMQAMLDELV
jgi:Tfp pilus assembly protein PilF